jgi:GDP-L-fucose synthase
MLKTIKFTDKILVTGHRGLVGSAIIRVLKKKGYKKIITISKKELNLLDQKKTFNFLNRLKPKFVFIAAAKVGGIFANNTYKADFIYDNLQIQNNLIHGSYKSGVKNLIFLGSSCVYPRNCKQPIKEEYILNGVLEKTNEPYAIAKIAGIKMCEAYNYQYNLNYKTLMPCNTFGPGDNYNSKTSHFLPALIKKIHQLKVGKSKKLKLWGTGKPRREFIYVDDLAEACVHFMNKKTNKSLINIGTGQDYTIFEIAKIALKALNVKAQIKFDNNKLDGTPRKILDISNCKKLGWKPTHKLIDSIKKTYNDYLNQKS